MLIMIVLIKTKTDGEEGEMRKDITHFVRVFVSVVGLSLRYVAHFPRSLL